MSIEETVTSSDELKKRVEASLAKAATDFEKIEEYLSVGNIIDRSVYGHSSKNPRTTAELLYQHPMGTTFLALGTLLFSDQGAQMRLPREKRAIKKLAQELRENTSALKDKIAVQGAQLRNAYTHSRTTVKQAAEEYLDLDNVNPLLLATLGFGLGASISASFGLSAQEEKIVAASTGDLASLRSDVEQAVKQAADRAKDAFAEELKSIRFSTQ